MPLATSNANEEEKNVLRPKLQNALKAIWNRLRKGYAFDVRANAADEKSKDEHLREYARTINRIAKTIEMASIDTEKLLELPAAPQDAAPEEAPEKEPPA